MLETEGLRLDPLSKWRPLRILSVASTLPYPPNDGTRIRTWNLMNRLSGHAEVTLLTWRTPDMDPELIETVRKGVHQLIVPPFAVGGGGTVSRAHRRVRSMLKGIPPYVLERLDNAAVPEALTGPYDLAIAEDDSALFLMPPVDCPIVVHRHNVFTDTISGLIDSGSLGRARVMKWKSELPIWRRYDEELSLRSALSVVTTREAERALKRIVPGAPVSIIPNGVEIPKALPRPSDGPVAVFIGQMDYEPNADAVVTFVKEVWPEIKRRVPEATFRIIGRRPLPAVRALAGAGVEVIGEVEDMVEACQGARVGVVPLNAGSGIKNKTLELMAMGRPVVASSEGSEGIRANPTDGLLKADSVRETVDAVATLLADPARSWSLGLSARRFARRYSWDQAAAGYVDVLKGLVDRTRSEQPVGAFITERSSVAV